MRLDQFLDQVCLFKTRSAASKAIRAGRVMIDDGPAKASHVVQPGEVFVIREGDRLLTVKVIDIPVGSVDRRGARAYYQRLGPSAVPGDPETVDR